MHAANVTNVTQQLREAGRAGFISGPVDMGWTDEVSLPLQRLPICPREQAEKLEARATGAEQLERTALEANIDLAGGNAPAAGRQRKKKKRSLVVGWCARKVSAPRPYVTEPAYCFRAVGNNTAGTARAA